MRVAQRRRCSGAPNGIQAIHDAFISGHLARRERGEAGPFSKSLEARADIGRRPVRRSTKHGRMRGPADPMAKRPSPLYRYASGPPPRGTAEQPIPEPELNPPVCPLCHGREANGTPGKMRIPRPSRREGFR